MYGRIINGSLTLANSISANGKIIINPTDQQYQDNGYYIVEFANQPAYEEGYVYFPEYIMGNNKIEQVWRKQKDHSQLSEAEVTALFVRQNVQTLSVTDDIAVRMKDFYPEWDGAVKWNIGDKCTYGGELFRRRTECKPPEAWKPGEQGTESLWEKINEQYDGTEFDPIPYGGNLALEKDKYYTENGKMYRCTQSTGVPVFQPLAELEAFVQVVNPEI